MAVIRGDIFIARSREIVFDVVADERNEPSFNSRMKRVELLTEEPIGPGSRFAATASSSRRDAEMIIEYTSVERPARLASPTTMPSMIVEGGLVLEEDSGGTLVRWSWTVHPNALLRLFGPRARSSLR